MVTDVTRMGGDKVCIAASGNGRTMRLHEPHPWDGWLDSVGGLRPGDIVRLEWRPARRYRRPHSEDGRWSPATFAKVRALRISDASGRIARSALPSVEKAFGKPLFLTDRGNPAFQPDRGSRSLASVVASNITVYPHAEGVRIDFTDAKRRWSMVPVEDLAIRQHMQSCTECSIQFQEILAQQYQSEKAVLRIGLGRPYRGGKNALGCYLQVNHIFPLPPRQGHFSDDKEAT